MIQKLCLMVRLGRLQFLVAGFLLFCSGAFLAVLSGTDFHPWRFFLGYLIFGLAHLSISYSNDYFDRHMDHFGTPTRISGGSGVLVTHPELSRGAKLCALSLMGCSFLLSFLFTFLFHFPRWFPLFVLAGILLGWYYSAPPLHLAYRGLGEISTALSIGLLVPGMGYLVMAGHFDPLFLAFALPLMFYGMFFILSVEMPDLESDRKGGKRTFVVRWGRRAGWRAIALSACIPSILFGVAAGYGIYAAGVNLWILFLLSCILLLAGLCGLVRQCVSPGCVERYATANLIALVLFTGMLDLYLLHLIRGPLV